MHVYLYLILTLVLLVVNTSGAAARKSVEQELAMIGQANSPGIAQKFAGDALLAAINGITSMRKGEFDEGASFFAEVLQSDDRTARNKVGRWYFKRGEYATATLYFQQTISVTYDREGYESACAWCNLGVAYIKLNNMQQARNCLEQATMLFDGIEKKEDPHIQQSALLAVFNLGLSHWHLGEFYDAWNCWGKVAQYSCSIEALRVIAGILLNDEKLDDAERVLHRIGKLQSVLGEISFDISSDIANKLGVIAFKKQNNKLAAEYFERASALGHLGAKDNLRLLKARTAWCIYL